MREELKPCPFCASSDLHVGEFDGPLEDGMTVYVRCLSCGATVEGEGVHPEDETRQAWARQEAAARWNRRSG